MSIGAFQEEYQRVMQHAAALQEAVAALKAQFEAGVLELMRPISEEDVTPEAGKFLLSIFGEGWRNKVFTFDDGVKFQAYPLQEGMRDADVISYRNEKDVTGIYWMDRNNGKPAWNAQTALAARQENESALAAGGQDALTALRKQRLNNYRGGFRYPPRVENGWHIWELRELDREHLESLGY